jgi:hypothetical protein
LSVPSSFVNQMMREVSTTLQRYAGQSLNISLRVFPLSKSIGRLYIRRVLGVYYPSHSPITTGRLPCHSFGGNIRDDDFTHPRRCRIEISLFTLVSGIALGHSSKYLQRRVYWRSSE